MIYRPIFNQVHLNPSLPASNLLVNNLPVNNLPADSLLAN
jgi:hypothetical protein